MCTSHTDLNLARDADIYASFIYGTYACTLYSISMRGELLNLRRAAAISHIYNNHLNVKFAKEFSSLDLFIWRDTEIDIEKENRTRLMREARNNSREALLRAALNHVNYGLFMIRRRRFSDGAASDYRLDS